MDDLKKNLFNRYEIITCMPVLSKLCQTLAIDLTAGQKATFTVEFFSFSG